MDVSYNTASGSLSIVPAQSINPVTQDPKETNTTYFLIFDGVCLTEDGLKDWLRLCVKQVDVLICWMFSMASEKLVWGNKLLCYYKPVVSVWCSQKQSKKPRKTKNSLSPQEIKHIHVSVTIFITIISVIFRFLKNLVKCCVDSSVLKPHYDTD